MTIGDRLKLFRAELRLKQSELGEKSGVSERAYQGYEADRSVPGGEAIEGFVRLGLNANWLLTGEGVMLLKDMNTADAVMPSSKLLGTIVAELQRWQIDNNKTLSPEAAEKAALALFELVGGDEKQVKAIAKTVLKLVA